MIRAVAWCLGRYATFSGRDPRGTFWAFAVFVALVLGGLAGVSAALFAVQDCIPYKLSRFVDALALLFAAYAAPPLLAAAWRRLHDVGRSGWWALLPVGVAALAVALTPWLLALAGAGPVADAERLAALVSRGPPAVAALPLAWWLSRPSEPGTNRHGPPPAANGWARSVAVEAGG